MSRKHAVVWCLAAAVLIAGAGIKLSEAKGDNDMAGKKGMKTKIYNYQTRSYEEREYMIKPEEEWKKILTDEQFYILRRHGTERPFTSPLNDNKKKGVYKSAASGVALFHSDHKFNSGTGWPSFYDVVDKENVELREDNTLFMKRIEVIDKISGSHLGHVFEDGPAPTGLRYCINGDALIFEEE